MKKFILSLLLLSCPFLSYSKTVKETEIVRSQNILGLFDKVCMGVYLDEDELNKFLIDNNFTDLNDETVKNKESEKDIRHYSIDHDKTRFFIDIEPTTCSISVKNSNLEIFNYQFKNFRKEITQNTITETSKSFEVVKDGSSFKISSYNYFTEEDNEQLPFEIFLNQTNSRKTPYQLKLSVKIEKRIEMNENKKGLKKVFFKQDKTSNII